MKIIKTAWENFGVGSIRLGRQGENLVRRLKVDISAPLEAHPDADFAIRVESPAGVVYNAAQTVQEDEWLMWDITDADTAVSGEGSVQIVMMGDGEEIAKTARAKTVVLSSLGSGGEAPDPVKDWLDEAQKLLEDLKDQGSVNEQQVREIITQWMLDNPLPETDPTVPEWAKQTEPPQSVPAADGAYLQLVTNADGSMEWVQRLAYSEYVNAVVVENVQLEPQGEGVFAYTGALQNDPIVGTMHTVVYNGQEYRLKGYEMDIYGQKLVVMGNSLLIGMGDNTDAPFMIMFPGPMADAMGGATIMFQAADGIPETVTLSVRVDGDVVRKKLPSEYLEDNTFVVSYDGDDFAYPGHVEVYAAYRAGKKVILKYNSGGVQLDVPLVMVNDESALYSTVYAMGDMVEDGIELDNPRLYNATVVQIGDYAYNMHGEIPTGIQQETDPTVPSWAKQPQKPTYTAAEVGAVSTEELETAKEEIVQDVLDQIPQGGGGGLPTGGEPYQQLVTDGDGNAKWEDRLCYEAEGAVLFDGTLIFEIGDDFSTVTIAETIDVVSGGEYNVYWNGTLYLCTASSLSNEGMTAFVLGNLGAMTGGTQTGEPFVIMVLPPELAAESGGGTQVIPLDGSETATLKIARNIVRKLPEKFYDADPPYIDLAAYGFGDYDGEDQRKTFSEIGLSEQEVLELHKKAEKLHAVFAVSTASETILRKCFGTADLLVIDGINFIYYTIIVSQGTANPDIFIVSFAFNPDGSGEIRVKDGGTISTYNN